MLNTLTLLPATTVDKKVWSHNVNKNTGSDD